MYFNISSERFVLNFINNSVKKIKIDSTYVKLLFQLIFKNTIGYSNINEIKFHNTNTNTEYYLRINQSEISQTNKVSD
ncbi:hypothetical protein bsdtw1_00197 [Clostridium fungisolvens]|uniref:Uncharacterized protein n=1 Tax=Clostridium fungisolvens TaxID=1604897 RepID=A0A6V8SC55_9CLOT|nr:hypothetical protein bsdtw1_00197 [Clostridium fungisolvens]